MVDQLVEAAIDRYGRILILKWVRERRGLKPETPFEVTMKGSEIIAKSYGALIVYTTLKSASLPVNSTP